MNALYIFVSVITGPFFPYWYSMWTFYPLFKVGYWSFPWRDKLGIHTHIFLPTVVEIIGQKVSLGTEFVSLGKTVTWKVKLFLLPSSMCPISDFFFLQTCAGTSLLDSQTSTKTLSYVDDCQNCCSLGRAEDGRKLLFCHFNDVNLFNIVSDQEVCCLQLC